MFDFRNIVRTTEWMISSLNSRLEVLETLVRGNPL